MDRHSLTASVHPVVCSDTFIRKQPALKREYEHEINNPCQWESHRPVQPGESGHPSLAANHSPSAVIDTKKSPGSASADQRYPAVPSFESEHLRSPSAAPSQHSYPDPSRPAPNFDPSRRQLALPQGQAYDNPLDLTGSPLPDCLAPSAKDVTFPVPGPNFPHRSHDLTDGLHRVGSQPYQHYRHQHQLPEPQAGVTYSQQHPQQGPIPGFHQNVSSSQRFNPTFGQDGGQGSNHTDGSSHALVASSHGSETAPTYTELLTSTSYHQSPSGRSFLPNSQLPVQDQWFWGLTPNTGFIDGVSGTFTNQTTDIASQPRDLTAFNPGFDNLNTNPLAHQSYFSPFSTTPHNPPLMGGGASWPEEALLTPKQEVDSSNPTALPQRAHVPDRHNWNLPVHGRPLAPSSSGVPIRSNAIQSSTEGLSTQQHGNGQGQREGSTKRKGNKNSLLEEGTDSTSARGASSLDKANKRQRVRGTAEPGSNGRRLMNEQERKDVAKVRKVGSCLRCKFQKQKARQIQRE